MHFNNIFLSVDFQNYLRTQTGNNTTVNIIISTVDYLLRVQVRCFILVAIKTLASWHDMAVVKLTWYNVF